MGLSLEMALCKGTSLKMAFLFALLVLLLQPEMAIAGKSDKPAKAGMPPLHWWRIRWNNNEWLYSDPFTLTWRSLSKAEESTLQDWLSREPEMGQYLFSTVAHNPLALENPTWDVQESRWAYIPGNSGDGRALVVPESPRSRSRSPSAESQQWQDGWVGLEG